MGYIIEKEKCVGCGYCELVCPLGSITAKTEGKKTYYEINPEKCKGCGQCSETCINGAIFPDENHKRIISIVINKEKCIGCSLCQKNCPVKAIEGVLKQPYAIIEKKCIKCGVCFSKCKKEAIEIIYDIPKPENKKSWFSKKSKN